MSSTSPPSKVPVPPKLRAQPKLAPARIFCSTTALPAQPRGHECPPMVLSLVVLPKNVPSLLVGICPLSWGRVSPPDVLWWLGWSLRLPQTPPSILSPQQGMMCTGPFPTTILNRLQNPEIMGKKKVKSSHCSIRWVSQPAQAPRARIRAAHHQIRGSRGQNENQNPPRGVGGVQNRWVFATWR